MSLNKLSLKRIITDIKDINLNPIEGIYINYDEKDLSIIHTLIIGPKESPYQYGIYYFTFRMPKSYPFINPDVKFKTTDGNIRFNPNMYECGKVCLSILGTWSGPGWSPIQSIKSVLLSIQSLFNDNPLINEPSYEGYNKDNPLSKNYIEYIRYNNYNFALLEMLKQKEFYPYFNEIIKKHFLDNYKDIIEDIKKYVHLDGTVIKTPLWNKKIKINYSELINKFDIMFKTLC